MTNDSKIAVGRNKDGRLEIFFVGANDYIYHNWQSESSSGWNGSFPFKGATEAKSLIVGQNNDGCLEMFYIGSDSSMYHTRQASQNQVFQDPEHFGGETRALALGRHGDGRLEIFCIGADNKLYHSWQTSASSAWSPLKPFFAENAHAITIARDSNERLQLFLARSEDNNIYFYREDSSSPTGWEDVIILGGEARSLVVGRNADKRLVLFYIRMDGTLCYNAQAATGDGWAGEFSFSHEAKDLTVGSNSEDYLELFFLSADTMYHAQQSAGGWSTATPFAGDATSFTLGKNIDHSLELLYRGKDGRLHHNRQASASSGWAGERLLDLDDPLFVAARQIFDTGASMHVNDHCFIYGNEDGRWHMFGIEANNPGYLPPPGVPGHFVHATSGSLTQGLWQREPNALEQLSTESALWAPHVVKGDTKYYMFYCSGSATDDDGKRYRISLATSTDLKDWTRHGNPLFEDGYHARDPFVMWNTAESKWVMYYTATESPQIDSPYVVACRTSSNLIDWGQKTIVYRDTHRGQAFGPTESPYVVRRGDYYYLFIGPRPYNPPTSPPPAGWFNWRDQGYDGTDVFRSRHWDLWTDLDKVGHIQAHAAEVVRDLNGDWYVSHAGIYRGGVYLLPLHWRDAQDEE